MVEFSGVLVYWPIYNLESKHMNFQLHNKSGKVLKIRA